MKKNDMIALIIAVVLVVGVGYYFYTQNYHSSSSSSATANQVEVAPTIPPSLDPNNTVKDFSTVYKVQDYKQPVALNGLGNSEPFGASQ